MRIALYGARGLIGSRALHEAAARGHRVTAVVPDVRHAPASADEVAVGDVTDPGSVALVAQGHDAVVCAIGWRRTRDPRSAVDAAWALVDGLPEACVTRLIVIGSATGLLVPGVGRLADSPAFPASSRRAALAQDDALGVYEQHGAELDWTYVAPAAEIAAGPRTGRYATGTDWLLADREGRSMISAEDCAVALLDELERPARVRGRLAVGPVR